MPDFETLGVGMVTDFPSGPFIVRATFVPALTAGMLTERDLFGCTTVDIVLEEEIGICFVAAVTWTGAM